MKKPYRICYYDATPGSILTAEFWYSIGAWAFAWAFDGVVAVKSVKEFLDHLAKNGKPGDEVQLWGHGRPGGPCIAGKEVPADAKEWKAIEGGSVWFRSCKVAQGERGAAYANTINEAGVSFLGHLSNIGTGGHSYLVGSTPQMRPWWNKKLKPEHSNIFAPNSVLPSKMTIPNWAFKKNPKLS